MLLKTKRGSLRTRNVEFDFWKFFAMVIIVIHHSYNLFENERIYFAYGSIFVEFFFIVSGFFMALSASKKEEAEVRTLGTETAGFIFRKLKRLLPYFVFAWITTLVSDTVYFGPKEVFSSENLLKVPFSIVFLHVSGIPMKDVVGTDWYLSAMFMSMAVIYPLLRYRSDIFTKLAAPLIAVSLYACMLRRDGYITGVLGWYGIFCKGFFRGFAGLCLGCSAFAVSKWLKEKFMYKGIPLLLSFVSTGCMVGAALLVYYGVDRKYQGTIVLMFYIAVLIIASGKASINALFGNSLCVWLGKLSMAVYLTHTSAIRWVNIAIENSSSLSSFRENRFGPPVITAVYVILSLLWGIVCIAVTEPLDKKFRAFLKKEKQRQLAAK